MSASGSAAMSVDDHPMKVLIDPAGDPLDAVRRTARCPAAAIDVQLGPDGPGDR